MAYEMLVGVNVVDEVAYKIYREKMLPILETYGGGFGYDFVVSEVLKSQTEAPINRVFIIYFTDAAASESFFIDKAYQKINQDYFQGAVSDTTVIARYTRP